MIDARVTRKRPADLDGVSNDAMFENLSAADYLALPSALSLRLWLFFFPIACINPLFVDHRSLGGSYVDWLLLLVEAHLVLGLVFIIARHFLIRANSRTLAISIVATAYLLGQTLRGTFIGYETVQNHWTDDMLLFYRVTLGSLVYLLILALFAVVLGAYDSHETLVRELQSSESRLRNRQSALEVDIEKINSDARVEVMEALEPQMSAIRQKMRKDSGPTELLETVSLLQAFNDQVLHSLTKNLILTNSDIELSHVRDSKPYKRNRDWHSTIDLKSALYPKIGFGLLFLINVGAAPRLMPINQFERFTFCYALLIGIPIYLLNRVVHGRNLNSYLTTLSLTSFYAVLSPTAFLTLQLGNVAIPRKLLFPELFIGGVIGFVLATFSLLTRDRILEIEKLKEVNANIKRDLSLMRQHRWLVRRRLAKVLHGRVQGVVVASTLNLASSEKSAELVLSDLEDSLLELLSVDASHVSIRHQLDELVEVWRNLIEVNYELPADLDQLLERENAATECVGEVIREAVNNAKKHGHCSQVSIHLTVNSDSVHIQVHDDGVGPGVVAEPGFGTDILNEICSRWSLTSNRAGLTEFWAEIPLQQPKFA